MSTGTSPGSPWPELLSLSSGRRDPSRGRPARPHITRRPWPRTPKPGCEVEGRQRSVSADPRGNRILTGPSCHNILIVAEVPFYAL